MANKKDGVQQGIKCSLQAKARNDIYANRYTKLKTIHICRQITKLF